jgi:predicted ATPase
LQIFWADKGRELLFYGGPKRTSSIDLDLRFTASGYSCSLGAGEDRRAYFADECVRFAPDGDWESDSVAEYPQGKGYVESALISRPLGSGEASETSLRVLKALRSWQVYHFQDTSRGATIKLASNVSDNRFLKPDGANIAAFLYYLKEKHERHYREIVDVIGLVAPFFLDFDLAPNRRNETLIELQWRERGFDDLRGPHQLSDGTLRFIALTTLLTQPDLPTTILLDEPELGLHPYAINILAELLAAASERTQVIVSTQSVSLLNRFAPEDVIVADREQGASAFRRLDSGQLEGWLEDYSLGELWEKNVLGGRPGR